MKRIVSIILLAVAITKISAQPGYIPTKENLEARKEFENSKFGIFVVWGTYSMLGSGEWVMNSRGYTQDEYSRLAGGFYPSKFDADQWIKIFKESGAKYITVTARHHDGFSLFQSDASSYNTADGTPFKRDIIGELAESCKKYGIKLNIYYSHLDWGRNDYYPLGNTGKTAGRPAGDENSWPHYINFMKSQLSELLTKYGPVGCIWFDGMWDRTCKDRDSLENRWQLYSTYKLIHSLQPACLIGNNHHLPVFEGEDFQIFEKDLPGKNTAGFNAQSEVSDRLPLETCETINGSWGYNISDKKFKSTDNLIKYLVRAAGKGANFLLDVGPRPDGTIQEEFVERLLGIGKWLEQYGETVYGTKAGSVPEQSWGVSTAKENKLFIHVLEKTDKIRIGIPSGSIKSAETFEKHEKVTFSTHSDSTDITLPIRPDNCPDQIIVLNCR